MVWIAPLIVAVIGLLVAVAAMLLAKRSVSAARQYEQQLNRRIEKLENELSAMMDGAFGVASQLQKVENNLKSTVQQQEQLRQRDMGNLPYNDAVRRVSKGADVDELVEHCGLSRSEAELVTMLHKKASAEQQAGEPQPQLQASTLQRAVHNQLNQQVSANNEFESPPQPTAENIGSALTADELGVLDNEQGPLFSGDLGGDDFQQALARAREFQAQTTTSNDETDESKAPASLKPQHNNDD